jgi:flagellar protein FliS
MTQDEYLATQIMTAAPEQLHLLIIDGAIRFAKQATFALEEGDYELANDRFVRCRNCVSELITGLDESQLPEVVSHLKAMFTFVYERIVRADLNHDQQLVADALQVLSAHRETWLQLMELESPQGKHSNDVPDTAGWIG